MPTGSFGRSVLVIERLLRHSEQPETHSVHSLLARFFKMPEAMKQNGLPSVVGLVPDHVPEHPAHGALPAVVLPSRVSRRPLFDAFKCSGADAIVQLELPRERPSRRLGPAPFVHVGLIHHEDLPLFRVGLETEREPFEPEDLDGDDVEEDPPDAVSAGIRLQDHRILAQVLVIRSFRPVGLRRGGRTALDIRVMVPHR